jgi:hypothetical protein
LANYITANTTAAGPPVRQVRLYLRPVTADIAGVVIGLNDAGVPVRIRRIGSRWLLDENVCTWLTIALGASERAQDRTVQSDLRNALTVEETYYTDAQNYTTSPAILAPYDPAIDWGGKTRVKVGDALAPGDKSVVCISEISPTGKSFAVAVVAIGPDAGFYYGARPCPSTLNPSTVVTLGNSFGT